jgi:phosphatidylglycerol---prolipoprotein diacylglyceryl transferase
MVEFFPSREIVVQLGSWSVRWYGLLYVIAFWVGWYLLPRIGKKLRLSRDQWTHLTLWLVVAAVVGGRLGYIFLYEPEYFLNHPKEIFSLWQGGMSSHGGFVGVGLMLWWLSFKLKVRFLALVDVIVVPVAFGLALGRIGNFINQELYAGYWALGVAVADALLGLCCWYFLSSQKLSVGRVTALFLIGYALIRFLNEFVRIDEWSHVWGLTYGQFLTLPIFLMGLWLWVKRIANDSMFV